MRAIRRCHRSCAADELRISAIGYGSICRVRQGIFVSYRRSDTLSATGRLCDHLRLRGFSAEDDIFLDIDNIPPGADFRKVIHDTLHKCDVVLLVIGRSWLTATDTRGRRRLDSASDTHRFEIKSALDSDVVVIPVLVEGAQHPSAEDLPDELSELAFRNSWEISDRRFAADVSGLAEHLRRIRARRIEPRPEASQSVQSGGIPNDVVDDPAPAAGLPTTRPLERHVGEDSDVGSVDRPDVDPLTSSAESPDEHVESAVDDQPDRDAAAEVATASLGMLRARVEEQSTALGPTHPHTLDTRRALADRLRDAGFSNWALYEEQLLLDDVVRTHGSDHPEARAARARVDQLHEAKGPRSK